MKRRIFSLLLSLTLWFCLPAPISYAASPESILNQAVLSPDPFLENEEADLFSLFSGFTPADADRMLKETIQAQTNDSMTTYQKVKALYDYIINNTEYGTGEIGGFGSYHSVYGVLQEHLGVCDNYNYVMMAFLRYLGIDAELVGGMTEKASGGYTPHAWVEAYIDGETYVFDPQIEDNVAKGGPIYNYFFCKTYAQVPGQYIRDYYVQLKSAYYDHYFQRAVETGTSLAEQELDKITLADLGFEVEGMDFSGWYYDEDCTQPIDLNRSISRDVTLWAGYAASGQPLSDSEDVSVSITVSVCGTPVTWTDAEPFIDSNNRTMVPLRAVAEALGLQVSWNADAREAGFSDGTKTILFPIDSRTAKGDDGEIEMDTAAVIVHDRTYAPIRYLAEYFSYDVGWDGETRTVLISR